MHGTTIKKSTELNKTIWMQLDNNEWLLVPLKPDILTEACPKCEPSDINLISTVKIKLNNMCKVYKSKICMQG
jgi:hypothetical protein